MKYRRRRISAGPESAQFLVTTAVWISQEIVAFSLLRFRRLRLPMILRAVSSLSHLTAVEARLSLLSAPGRLAWGILGNSRTLTP